ncbi:hypothetical protein QFZ62_001475 [Clavibacter sp. B3I6]|uniref:hypothetical protein n=1 Tax=Clavibacter sp. B3I6 TaxID=3042268 RepID=UPI00278408DF|nr:hypothetical protein [Clavibacter sp. B3I6]MDQ0744167.1 hypothetical protein [Clavibacter sp. B3I6]
MKITRLQIDSQTFYLDDAQDVDALQAEIVEAAARSASFVHFDTIGHGRVSVLVTQRLGVRFEIQDRTEEELAEWEAHPPVIDYPLLEL